MYGSLLRLTIGWASVPRWEPLLRDVIILANKLEKLGFRYIDGQVAATGIVKDLYE